MADTRTILVVDDERMMRESVSSFLSDRGYQVVTADTGQAALRIMGERSVSLVILDLMLPDISGEEVCRRVRESSGLPIIMLTAKTMEKDLLNGLSIGADDYVTKPFSLKELAARVEAVLRRTGMQTDATELSWNGGDLSVNLLDRRVKKAGRYLELTHIEWNILSALCSHPSKVFTRDELLDLAFDRDFDGLDRVIDTHIKNLRKKLEDDTKNPVYIITVHGIGYRFGGTA